MEWRTHGDGVARRIDYLENDHCCQLFCRASVWLQERGLQADGPVGHAPSKLMRSRDLVETVVGQLAQDRFALIHSRDVDCEECLDAWNSVPC